MKSNDIEKYVAYKAKVVEQVLVWLVLDLAKFRYHNSQDYIARLNAIRNGTSINNKNSNYMLKEFSTLFNFDKKTMELLCGGTHFVEGKFVRLTKRILDRVKEGSKLLHYVGKKDVMYKSGKKFSRPGYWFIDTRVASKVFSNADYSNPHSDFYLAEAHALIDGFAFHYAKAKNIAINDIFEKHEKDIASRMLRELTLDYLMKTMEKDKNFDLKKLKSRIRSISENPTIEKKDKTTKKLEAKAVKTSKQLAVKTTDSDFPADGSDIPEDDEPAEKKTYITRQWLQDRVLEHKLSPRYAARIWKNISHNQVQFRGARQGWCIEDTERTAKFRSTVIKHLLSESSHYKFDSDTVVELQKDLAVCKHMMKAQV